MEKTGPPKAKSHPRREVGESAVAVAHGEFLVALVVAAAQDQIGLRFAPYGVPIGTA